MIGFQTMVPLELGGVGISIYINTPLTKKSFSFNDQLNLYLKEAIDHTNIIYNDGDEFQYGDAGPPQFLLDYKNKKFKLTIELYDRDAKVHTRIMILNPRDTKLYLNEILLKNVKIYDLARSLQNTIKHLILIKKLSSENSIN